MQLGPDTRNPMFAFCFLTVTEPKRFGCMGYVQMTGENGKPGGQAYYRPQWDEMSPPLGWAEWVVGEPPEPQAPPGPGGDAAAFALGAAAVLLTGDSPE